MHSLQYQKYYNSFPYLLDLDTVSNPHYIYHILHFLESSSASSSQKILNTILVLCQISKLINYIWLNPILLWSNIMILETAVFGFVQLFEFLCFFLNTSSLDSSSLLYSLHFDLFTDIKTSQCLSPSILYNIDWSKFYFISISFMMCNYCINKRISIHRYAFI